MYYPVDQIVGRRSRIADSGYGVWYPGGADQSDIGKGTGQGLALTHSVIVERMGGSIDVESTVGEGTAFLLRLPLRSSNKKGTGL